MNCGEKTGVDMLNGNTDEPQEAPNNNTDTGVDEVGREARQNDPHQDEWKKAWESVCKHEDNIVIQSDAVQGPLVIRGRLSQRQYIILGREDASHNYRTWARSTRAHWLVSGGSPNQISEKPDRYTLVRFHASRINLRETVNLYGHPQGSYFRTPKEFFPHFQYLAAKSLSGENFSKLRCPCRLCTTTARIDAYGSVVDF
ncbi:hypothetical protein M011DRAFT_57554 [Sporormia fimetaria CBS 119925]|uniref:Cryptic loci regulator 2 N-terminal domain-containing protein n=1 Tax=Sporormia fimetaria CBS 119925 TaxID=1340428 RepID=A0A6A6VE03_9PLEO|nr:hypothetical protein M011DRAFT_57554 [Sporormia fimetaria CBS 119925]